MTYISIWYAFAYMCILAVKSMITNLVSIDPEVLYIEEGMRANTWISCGRGNRSFGWIDWVWEDKNRRMRYRVEGDLG